MSVKGVRTPKTLGSPVLKAGTAKVQPARLMEVRRIITGFSRLPTAGLLAV